MTYTSLIAFAPVASSEVLTNAEKQRPGRLFYDRNAFKLKPGGVPLVVDHDKGKEIGRVSEFSVLDNVDGLWHVALATVEEPVPAWLKRGTGASCKFIPFFKGNVGGVPIIREALLLEVTVTSPNHEPVDASAKVLTFRPTKPPKAASPRVAARSSRPVARARADRYLSRAEVENLIVIAGYADVQQLAELIAKSGELQQPDRLLELGVRGLAGVR